MRPLLYVIAMRFVVTGTNRGIGLEFVKQLTARGEQVDATVRDPLTHPSCRPSLAPESGSGSTVWTWRRTPA